MICSFQEMRDVLYFKGGIPHKGIVNSCRAHDQKSREEKSGDVNHLTLGYDCDKHSNWCRNIYLYYVHYQNATFVSFLLLFDQDLINDMQKYFY